MHKMDDTELGKENTGMKDTDTARTKSSLVLDTSAHLYTHEQNDGERPAF
jgi:hypothetical protein